MGMNLKLNGIINMETITNLKQARLTAGLSNTEISAKLGVSRVTLYNWERNPKQIKLCQYRKLKMFYTKFDIELVLC